MSRYIVNASNQAESTEDSRFPPPCVEFCSVGSPRACRTFERATQPIVRDDPWHHIDQLCMRALTPARAFAAEACRAGPRARKSQIPRNRRLCNLVSTLCSETDPNWGRRFSSILGFRTPNCAQRNALVYRNRINRHFGFGERKYREMEFRPLGNESSPFCRTEWFHIHVKMAFFHLSVWLIGQGSRKLRRRPWLDSWQFVAQAGKWRWAENRDSAIFFFRKLEILIQVLIELT